MIDAIRLPAPPITGLRFGHYRGEADLPAMVGAREAGFTSASLGVDRDSPTGATDLYRSLGFQPERTFIAWRKAL